MVVARLIEIPNVSFQEIQEQIRLSRDPDAPPLTHEYLAKYQQTAQDIASIANAAGARIDSTNILKVEKALYFGTPTEDDMRERAAHGLSLDRILKVEVSGSVPDLSYALNLGGQARGPFSLRKAITAALKLADLIRSYGIPPISDHQTDQITNEILNGTFNPVKAVEAVRFSMSIDQILAAARNTDTETKKPSPRAGWHQL